MRVFPLAPLGVGTLFFRDPTPRLAFVVKLGLRIVGDAAASLVVTGDVSPLGAADFAPRKARPEMIDAPGGLGPRVPFTITPSPASDEREAWWSERWLEVALGESGERFQAARAEGQLSEELRPGSPLTLRSLVPPMTLPFPPLWPWLSLVERGRDLESARRLTLRLDTLHVDTHRGLVDASFRAEVELGTLTGYPDLVVGLGRGLEPPPASDVAALLASAKPVAAQEPWSSASETSPVRGGTLPPGALVVEPTLDDDTSDRPTQHPPRPSATLVDDEDEADDDQPTPPPRRAPQTAAPPPLFEQTVDEDVTDDEDDPRARTVLNAMSPVRPALPFARGHVAAEPGDGATGTGTVIGGRSPAAGALPFRSKRETQIPPPAPTSGRALPFASASDTMPPAALPLEPPLGTGTVLGAKSPAAGALPFARGGSVPPPPSRAGTPFEPTGPASTDEMRAIAAALGPISRSRAETLPMERRASRGAALPFARSQNPPAPPPSAPVRPSSTIPPPALPAASVQPPWAPPPPPSFPFGFGASAPATEPPPPTTAQPFSLAVAPPEKPKLGARELARALLARPDERPALLAAAGIEALGFARARAAWRRGIDAQLAAGESALLDELLAALHGAAVAAHR